MKRHEHNFVLAMVIGLVGGVAPWGCSDPEPPPATRPTTREAPAVRPQPLPVPTTAAATREAPAAQEETLSVEQPDPGPVTFADAEKAYQEHRYAEAVAFFTSYTAEKPHNAWGHYMLGLASWKSGQSEMAERAFETALQLDPRHVKSLLNWSRVLLDTGHNEAAIVKIEAALDIDPACSDAYRLLGRAREALGETEAALEAYRHALVLDERDAWSMNNMGLIWIREGRFAEALPPLARAVALRADVATFHNNLGVALERTGHPSAAAAAYRQAVALNANYEKASISLARVEARAQSTAVESIDLAAVAQGFEAEVRGWRESMPSQAHPSSSAGDPTMSVKAVAANATPPMDPDDD